MSGLDESVKMLKKIMKILDKIITITSYSPNPKFKGSVPLINVEQEI